MNYCIEFEGGPMDGEELNNASDYLDEGDSISDYYVSGQHEGEYIITFVEGMRCVADWVPDSTFKLVPH